MREINVFIHVCLSVCLQMGPYVTATHDAIDQSQVTCGPLDLSKLVPLGLPLGDLDLVKLDSLGTPQPTPSPSIPPRIYLLTSGQLDFY